MKTDYIAVGSIPLFHCVCVCQYVFCTVHSHISLYQSIHTVYAPPEAAEQDDDKDDDDQSRKSPAQQEVEQVSTLCVLIIHHQHLPEVHRLRTQFEKTACVQDCKQKNR